MTQKAVEAPSCSGEIANPLRQDKSVLQNDDLVTRLLEQKCERLSASREGLVDAHVTLESALRYPLTTFKTRELLAATMTRRVSMLGDWLRFVSWFAFNRIESSFKNSYIFAFVWKALERATHDALPLSMKDENTCETFETAVVKLAMSVLAAPLIAEVLGKDENVIDF